MRRTVEHGFWTISILKGCTRCSRRWMVSLFQPWIQKVGFGTCILARERMIGWYHTGPKLRASDQEINDLFKWFIAKPVMVIVDVRPNTVGIPTDAYFAVEEIKDVSPHHHSISGSFFWHWTRTGRRWEKRFYTSHLQLKWKKPRRSALSIYLTQKIRYACRRRRERKKDLDTFYLISAIYT